MDTLIAAAIFGAVFIGNCVVSHLQRKTAKLQTETQKLIADFLKKSDEITGIQRLNNERTIQIIEAAKKHLGVYDQ